MYYKFKILSNITFDIVSFFCTTLRYNASIKTEKDIEKMQYTILRENHIIEKGMSMRNPRKGFGQEKVKNLLSKLDFYFSRYFNLNPDFLKYPLSTILTYIQYHKKQGVDMSVIEKKFNVLLKKTEYQDVNTHAGIKEITKKEIQKYCNTDFESLLNSRHSIRYFEKGLPDKSLIEKALILAQKTPSACNRQAWKTYIFCEEKSYKLLKWQGGANGFEDEIPCSILVTANTKGFLSHEIHQAYIDGGLYAMNLINALHSQGLGTIPLSLGFHSNKLKMLEQFGIPESEVPVVIVGTGNLLDSFNIAVSTRKSIEETNKWM